jgi:hypothetical protein
MLVGFRHVFLMTLVGLRFDLDFATLRQGTLLYYSDWQYVQALACVIA